MRYLIVFSMVYMQFTWGLVAEAKPSESMSESVFVGCRPSLGECQMSCPERNGKGVENADECQNDPSGFAVGCYCPIGFQPPPIDSSKFDFLGCYYSSGECSQICRGRTVVPRPHDERCSLEGIAHLACYCSKAQQPEF